MAHKAHLPLTVVPGAQRMMVPGLPGMLPQQAFDRKGRALWHMPKPITAVYHFKSEGARREYEAKVERLMEDRLAEKITIEEANKEFSKAKRKAVVEVPVYAGLNARLFRRLKAHAVYLREAKKRNLALKMPIIASVQAGLQNALAKTRLAAMKAKADQMMDDAMQGKMTDG